MARKTKKKQKVKPTRPKAERGPSALRRWLAGVPAETWRRTLRIGVAVVLIGGLAVGGAIGLEIVKERLRASAHRMVGPQVVQIVTEPPPPVPPSVRTKLQENTGLPERFDYCDARHLKHLANHYAAQPWVRRVVRVQQIFPDRIAVHLEYRRPVAFVVHGWRYYWVDAEGVRLPGEYSLAEGPHAARQMVIRDVEAAPPQPGEPWPGEDLAAALRLVRGLAGRVAAGALKSVSVDNYNGRRNPATPHLVLHTRYAAGEPEVRWGSAPGEERVFEATFSHKLEQLDRFHEATELHLNNGRVLRKERGLAGPRVSG